MGSKDQTFSKIILPPERRFLNYKNCDRTTIPYITGTLKTQAAATTCDTDV